MAVLNSKGKGGSLNGKFKDEGKYLQYYCNSRHRGSQHKEDRQEYESTNKLTTLLMTLKAWIQDKH